MKRWLVCTLIAAVVLALGVFAAVSAKDSSDDSDDSKNTASQGRKHADDRGGRVKADNEGRGHGPPSWAHSQKGKPDKAAREEWRQLTPAQRRALIDRLITEHSEGMKEWRECVLAERDDCEMPFPPGLARRR
jgi:hypothetical protein